MAKKVQTVPMDKYLELLAFTRQMVEGLVARQQNQRQWIPVLEEFEDYAASGLEPEEAPAIVVNENGREPAEPSE